MKTQKYILIIVCLTLSTKNLELEEICTKNPEKVEEYKIKFTKDKKIDNGTYYPFYKIENSIWKFFTRKGNTKEENETYFLNELSAMKNFSNFNIINYDECFFSIDSENFFGIIKINSYKESLFEKLSKEDFNNKSLYWKFDMLFQIANSLKKLHSANYIHRDINPKSIFLTNSYTPILSELGETTTIEIGEGEKVLLGSYPYIAPELRDGAEAETQYGEEAVYSKASDIYALAGVFYSVITGNDCEEVDEEEDISEEIDDHVGSEDESDDQVGSEDESDDQVGSEDESDEKEESDYKFDHENNPDYYEDLFENLINSMTNETVIERPKIDGVLKDILKTLPKIIELQEKSEKFDDYLKKENEELNSEKNDEVLIEFDLRKKLYEEFRKQKGTNEVKKFEIDKFLKI